MPVYPAIPLESRGIFVLALARYLDAQGLVDYDENGARGDCFVGPMPKVPDRAVSITGSGGLPDAAAGTLPYDRPTAQILVRSERGHYAQGEQRAWAIYDRLNGVHRAILDEGGADQLYLVGMTVPVPPYYLRTDQAGRHLWTLNLQAMVKRPSQNRPTT